MKCLMATGISTPHWDIGKQIKKAATQKAHNCHTLPRASRRSRRAIEVTVETKTKVAQ